MQRHRTASRLEGFRGLGLLIVLLLPIPVTADEPPATEVVTAPVVLDGVELFRVRGALALPAAERARLIGARLVEFAADRSLASRDLHIVEGADRSIVQIGDRVLVAVVDADAELEGLSRRQVAELEQRQIAQAVERYRHDRAPATLVRAGVLTVIAILIAVALMFGARRLFARLDALAERRYQERIERLGAETRKIIQAERLRTTIRGTFEFVSGALQIVFALIGVHFVLGLWAWTRPAALQVLDLIIGPLRTMGAAVLASIPGLVFIILLAVITRYLLRVMRLYFAAIADGTVAVAHFDRDWAWPTYRIARLVVIVFALVVAYPHIPGSDSAAFKSLSVFIGVVFSLGSTSVIANLVAGYTLVYRRAFKVGDRVRIGDYLGNVTAMRLQVTHLRSLKNEEIVIPNSVVLNSASVNYSTLAAEQGLILHTTVGIGYETPWRQVEAMLTAAAQRTAGLRREPPPFVLQRSLGDFCVVYELNAYCDHPLDAERLYTELHRNILDEFNEHSVQIMTPAYESDPAEPKVVAKANWFAPPARPPSTKADS